MWVVGAEVMLKEGGGGRSANLILNAWTIYAINIVNHTLRYSKLRGN